MSVRPMPGAIQILAVDDRPANLVALGAALASPDYRIVNAASGAEALRFLLKNDCALILMDVNMPGMDGYETARLIRKSERTRDIPIVFLTAFGAGERHVLAGYESGAIDYLLKPVQPEVLRSKVAGFVTLHRARLEIARQAELLREHERRAHAHAVAELEVRALRREQAAQRRYQALVEGLSHAIVWVLDPVTKVCSYVSPSAQALGYPLERWKTDPHFFTDHLPPDDRARFLAEVARLEPSLAGTVLEHRLVRADGSAASFETSLRLLPAEDAGRLELRGLSLDVTDAVEAREAAAFLAGASVELTRSLDVGSTARRGARLATQLADWCAVEVAVDDEPAVVAAAARPDDDDAAHAAAGALSLPALRAVGDGAAVDARPLFATDPGDAPTLGAPCALVLPLAARGSRFGTLALFAAAPLAPSRRGTAEELARRLAQALDNARLHRAAQDAVRAREEFLSVASHELRTPITALSLQAKLLAQRVAAGQLAIDPAARADLDRRLTVITRQVDRLGALVNAVLDVARIRSKGLTLELGRCNLREVLRDVASRFEEALAGEGRALRIEATDDLFGTWDRTRVEQLVTNLVSNAVKHGERSAVTVTAGMAQGCAVLTVADGGPGIPRSEQRRIFDAFAQARGASRAGLGLGLYISRKIVEAHGGRISLESAPGRGTSFRVELPLGGDEFAVSPDGSAAAQGGSSGLSRLAAADTRLLTS